MEGYCTVTMEDTHSGKENKNMAIRQIREIGDDVLTKNCKEVAVMTPRIEMLIEDMFDTMYKAEGVGLAASQVGVLRQVVVLDIGNGPITLINPKIIEQSGSQTGDEGCLSVPGKVGQVTRPEYVKVKSLNKDMKEVIVEGEGLLARCICHEIDHLTGKLYVDQVKGGLRAASQED